MSPEQLAKHQGKTLGHAMMDCFAENDKLTADVTQLKDQLRWRLNKYFEVKDIAERYRNCLIASVLLNIILILYIVYA